MIQSRYKNLIFLSFFSVILLAIPVHAKAQSKTEECKKLIEQFNQAQVGGQNIGASVVASLPQYCTEGSVYNKIINIFYYLIGTVGVAFYIYGGYLYMVSGASESSKKAGKDVLLYTTVGIIIVLLAVTVVNLIVSLITKGL